MAKNFVGSSNHGVRGEPSNVKLVVMGHDVPLARTEACSARLPIRLLASLADREEVSSVPPALVASCHVLFLQA